MELFFELLQVALGNRQKLSRVPSPSEWEEILDMAVKQALVGVMYDGFERLPNEQLPEKLFRIRWVGLVQQLEAQSVLMDFNSAEVLRVLEKAGFEGCILKGQGNALMYPRPVRRQYGDIDVWARPTGSKRSSGESWKQYFAKNRNLILSLVQKNRPNAKVHIHHIEVPIKDADLEIHFFPTYLMNPFSHRRLLQFFGEEMDVQFANEVHTLGGERLVVPTAQFNVVFQLVHVFLHYLNQGIGLRQIVDYYYVLKESKEASATPPASIIRQLHLERFEAALMWVLLERLGMPEAWMLCEPDAREGRRVLDEVMQMGNFGQYDERISKSLVTGPKYYWEKLKRKLRLLWLYPHEVIWDPWWRLTKKEG